MKNFFKKLVGLDKLEAAKAQAEQEREEALARVAEAKVRE